MIERRKEKENFFSTISSDDTSEMIVDSSLVKPWELFLSLFICERTETRSRRHTFLIYAKV